MKSIQAAVFVGLVLGSAACNAERKQECDKFLTALTALTDKAPSAEAVSRAHDALVAIHFDDEPLREYSKSAATMLTVLSNTLTLEADPSAPSGTVALAALKLKEAQGARDDVARYCTP